ncbi:MAG: shikimate kinase [Clostridia bacterium]|nr:shikimate kinase [Clostridia bacterium]
MNNIILTGFMGTGKTTVGRRLAAMLGLDFKDTDEYVKKCEKMTVYDVIKKKGRKYFEGAERFAVINLAECENTVISTGGTCLWNEENRQTLKKSGKLIWLKASADTVYQNTKNSRNKRSELCGLSFCEVEDLVKLSEKHYENCDFSVCVDDKEVDEIAKEIISFLQGQRENI